jgi:EAL domain-containing protein (putative c-di-GMP-specific phosphodiesterase class I)
VRQVNTTRVGELATVRSILAPGGVSAAFQPIVDLGDRSVHAWEALGRVAPTGRLAPDAALAMAERVGRSADLETAFWDAVAAAGPPPGDAALFVNVGTAALTDPGMVERLADLPAHVVIEITERVAASDDDLLLRTVERLAALGTRFAVDDIGNGYSSLRRVLDLAPDYLKLDASLVHGLAADGRLRAALDAVVAFARAVDARLVAEGVERFDDLLVLVDSGVDLAQGFLLGRPGPPWPLPTSELVDLTG